MRKPVSAARADAKSENNMTRDAVTRGTGNVFTGILLALILKSTLDVFFKNVAVYASIWALFRAAMSHAASNLLDAFQLVVFMVMTTRFYWGTYRYNEEAPQSEGTPQLILGLIGAVLVFSSFYVTGLLVRNPRLFYASFALTHVIDLFWFLIAATWLKPPLELQKVWSWYKLFDVVTIISLLVLIGVGHFAPARRSVCNWAGLAVLVAVSFWDFRELWPYYVNKTTWRSELLGAL